MHTHTPLPIQETVLINRLTVSGPKNVYYNHDEVTNAYTVEFSPHQFRHTYDHTMSVDNTPLLGFNVEYVTHKQRLRLILCCPGTKVAKNPRWRTILKLKYIDAVDGFKIRSLQDLETAALQICENNLSHVNLTLLADDTDLPSMANSGCPQIYFDQMNVIHHTCQAYTRNKNNLGCIK